MNEKQTPASSLFNNVFVSPDEQRLRAGWRLLLHTILLLFITGGLGIMAVLFLLASGLIVDPSLSVLLTGLEPVYLLLGTLGETVAVTASVFFARRYLDKRSIESLGLKFSSQAIVDILTGIGISLLQIGLIYLLMSRLGWITFEGFAWEFDPLSLVTKNMLIFFAMFVLVGWHEELLSRGYRLQTIASGLNLFWGVTISSAIFGLLHLGNPNGTWVSVAGIFFAGLYLAYGYTRTKQLWLPMGLHIGWNFFEGVVFGFPVSGLGIYALTRIQVNGPELWTGGAFGPEAGLIVLPSLLLGGVLIHLFTRGRVK